MAVYRLGFKIHSDIRMIMFSNYCCHQPTSYRIMKVPMMMQHTAITRHRTNPAQGK